LFLFLEYKQSCSSLFVSDMESISRSGVVSAKGVPKASSHSRKKGTTILSNVVLFLLFTAGCKFFVLLIEVHMHLHHDLTDLGYV